MKTDDVTASLRGARKTYDGETLVIKHLDLGIYQGEFPTLLGPSGSDKITCLMMPAGFEFPTDGEIRLEDVLLNNMSPCKYNIGMVFQNYVLFPHMTVAQNVEHPLIVRKLPAAEHAKRVHKALQMVRVEGFAKRYPAQFSGGQQQHIASARALVFEPKPVLMDEPLGTLDKQLREHMQYELKSLHEKFGVTLIYVTHDQGEALTMSDRVAAFDKGIVQQLDTVDSLYERPCNEFVTNFIGNSNMLRGTVTRIDGDYCKLQLNDGARVVGRNIAGTNVGAMATGCIRLERMRPAEGASAAGNALVGQTRGLVYFDDHVRMCCVLPDQPECFVKVPLGTRALEGFAPDAPTQLEFVLEHLCAFV